MRGPRQTGGECLLDMAFEVDFFSKTVGTRKDKYKRVLRSAGEQRFLESWRVRMYSLCERIRLPVDWKIWPIGENCLVAGKSDFCRPAIA